MMFWVPQALAEVLNCSLCSPIALLLNFPRREPVMVEGEQPEVPISVRCYEFIEIPDFYTILPTFDVREPIPMLFCLREDTESNELLEKFPIGWPFKEWKAFCVLPVFTSRCHKHIINNFTINRNCRMLQE